MGNFWKNYIAQAYSFGWMSIEQMRTFVKTDLNPFGYITAEEFKGITGEEF